VPNRLFDWLQVQQDGEDAQHSRHNVFPSIYWPASITQWNCAGSRSQAHSWHIHHTIELLRTAESRVYRFIPRICLPAATWAFLTMAPLFILSTSAAPERRSLIAKRPIRTKKSRVVLVPRTCLILLTDKLKRVFRACLFICKLGTIRHHFFHDLEVSRFDFLVQRHGQVQ
jgi:hypothetical protein